MIPLKIQNFIVYIELDALIIISFIQYDLYYYELDLSRIFNFEGNKRVLCPIPTQIKGSFPKTVWFQKYDEQ